MTYIIAEAGINHNGSISNALQLVKIASNAGADAVKFQTYKTDNIAEKGSDRYEMLKKCELPYSAFKEIKAFCFEANINFLSSAFDEDSYLFLSEELKEETIKIPSGRLLNKGLLEIANESGCDLIVSTGMVFLEEIEKALEVLTNNHVALLHCTSMYPLPYDKANVRVIDTLRNQFDLPIGFSDHTQGTLAAQAAVCRGACIIEKHFMSDKNCPDLAVSVSPVELNGFVKAIRKIEQALGSPKKDVDSNEFTLRDIILGGASDC